CNPRLPMSRLTGTTCPATSTLRKAGHAIPAYQCPGLPELRVRQPQRSEKRGMQSPPTNVTA
ncbi:hypothetical protein WDW89_16810, partial [Deltaproteobacteria bacterium TL4]